MGNLNTIESVKEQLKPYLGQYLAMRGIRYTPGRNFVCINPSHDDWPGDGGSCGIVRGNESVFHCFGCLEDTEPIWTNDGLKNIGNVAVGDLVLDRYGKYEPVLAVMPKDKPLMEIKVASMKEGLALTPDHTCLYVSKEEAIKKLPYLQKDKSKDRNHPIKFYGRLKNLKRSYKSHPKSPIQWTDGPAENVKKGDFFLFPVIADSDRSARPLRKNGLIRSYTSGPVVDRINELPVNEEAAYLYGLYLAEGHTNDRTVFFSLHLNEGRTLAKKIQRILKRQFNLESTISEIPKKTSSLLTCSKVDLVAQLNYWFGSGAAQKRLPPQVMSWPKSIQKALWDGYYDGDGNHGSTGHSNKTATTISRDLAYGLYCLQIQMQELVYLGYGRDHIDGELIYHTETRVVSLPTRERVAGFYEPIDGVMYYWSIVESTKDLRRVARVIDITVANSHSFVTKLGIVHNCLQSGDIFLAAHFLENKPLTGKAFIVENLKYLAELFGVEMPEFKLSEEDLYELQVRTAYSHAASILTSSELSAKVTEEIERRGWSKETREKLGVGSVKSFSDYMDRMIKLGHTTKFLGEIDLGNSAMFNENNLIFTVCMEDGSPIGFACRRLTYKDDIEAWQAASKAISEDASLTDEEKKAKHDQLPGKPVKYVNTSTKNRFYQKGKRLFGFHLAKKFAPPLYVMEGYPDGTTAVDMGLKNACAIGATAFTREHVDVLLESGIKHIIIVLDGDEAGYTGTDRAVKIIEEAVGDRIGFKVELIQMPVGTDDPDEFLRLYGIDEFVNLPRMDIFSWKINRDIQAGGDPIQLANEAIPLIVNEPNYLLRLNQVKKLAQVTGVDEDFIRHEVLRRVDEGQQKVSAERALIVHRMVGDLKKNPDAVTEITRQAISQIEIIEKRSEGFEPQNVLSAYEFEFERQMANMEAVELVTGYPKYDFVMGGVPKGATFISIPGKPNQGKSSALCNLSHRLVHFNSDVVVMYHTIDDALYQAIPRILGSKAAMPSKLFQKAGYYLKHPDGRNWVAEHYPDFPGIYHQAKQWLSDMVADERLIVADINLLPGSMPALEDWLKTIRKRHPHQPIVCMGDNFALYHLEVEVDSEAVRARRKSQFAKRMANTYQACVMMTCELTKESLKPGVRPRMASIKDTGGVAYDANANLGIYNDLKDRGDSADLVWLDSKELVSQELDGGLVGLAPRRKPIIEMVIDKNKITDYDGSIFFELDNVSGELRECDDNAQAIFRSKAEVVTSKVLSMQMGGRAA